MTFTNQQGIIIPYRIITTIQDNKQYLSDIDGAIGDGDHGINMSKGMTIAKENMNQATTMSEGLQQIQLALMNKIGGSMGPLYGMMFRGMVQASKKYSLIDGFVIEQMLNTALSNLQSITDAKPGDKTLLDVLQPAVQAYQQAYQATQNSEQSIHAMLAAADNGLENTKHMIAKLGRASRLKERSLHHQDAGATSCNLILHAIAEGILSINQEETACNDL